MFLHLGEKTVVYKKNIVAILDAKSILSSKINREFLRTCAEEGFIDKITDKNPRSFVVIGTAENRNAYKTKIYCSSISAITLRKRAGFIKGNFGRR